MRILVVGGAGFIESAVCRHLVEDTAHCVVNLDNKVCADNPASLWAVEHRLNYKHVKADICNEPHLLHILQKERIDAVIDLAAENHPGSLTR